MRLGDDGGDGDTIKLFLLLCTIVSMNKKSKPKCASTSEKKSHEFKKGLIKSVNIQLIYILIHTKPINTNAQVIKDTWR